MQIQLQLDILTHLLSTGGELTKAEVLLDLIRQGEHTENDNLNGYVLTSVNALAGRWGWSRGKVNKFLAELEDKGIILIKKPDTAGNTRFVIYVQAVQYVK